MWNVEISRWFRPARAAARQARERSRQRALERASQWSEDDWLNSQLPPLDWRGLALMDERSDGAHPSQIRRWIADIHEQLPTMDADDMSYAMALLLKLERLVQEHRVFPQRRA